MEGTCFLFVFLLPGFGVSITCVLFIGNSSSFEFLYGSSFLT